MPIPKQMIKEWCETYEEAVDIFLSGGGTTDEVDSTGGNWECIQGPIDDEKENANVS